MLYYGERDALDDNCKIKHVRLVKLTTKLKINVFITAFF